MIRHRWLALAFAFTACAVTVPAHARDTTYMLPMKVVLDNPAARAGFGNDVSLSFGSALPDGLSIVGEPVLASESFNPQTPVDLSRALPTPHTDEQACAKAFYQAVRSLLKQARKQNATHVVGIVSYYDEKVMDSPDKYECHAGMIRTVVELRGLAAVKGPTNGPTMVPRSAAAVAAIAPTSAHRSAVPAATGFARGDDASAVPLSDAGKARYSHYLTLPSPKAFVIYDIGAWRFYSDDVDAMTKALDYCAQEKKTCWLYAVDDRVVWSDNVSRRIGKSTQLGNE